MEKCTSAWWVALSTVFALLLAGCLRVVAVEQAAVDANRLVAGGDFVLVVAAEPGGEGAPIDLLRRKALDGLVEKGYRPAAEGELMVKLVAGERRVRARTMTADPGYNSYALRERKEAAVSLAIFGAEGEEPLWRGSARVILPKAGLMIGPDPVAAWLRALAEVVDQLPDRRGEAGE